MLIKEEDKDKVIKVLKAKKSLLSKWYEAINDLQRSIEKGEDTDRYIDDWQLDDDDKSGYGYLIGCIDEDDNGISVFPKYRSQITLHKYSDGSWG